MLFSAYLWNQYAYSRPSLLSTKAASSCGILSLNITGSQRGSNSSLFLSWVIHRSHLSQCYLSHPISLSSVYESMEFALAFVFRSIWLTFCLMLWTSLLNTDLTTDLFAISPEHISFPWTWSTKKVHRWALTISVVLLLYDETTRLNLF